MALSFKKLASKDISTMKVSELKSYISTLSARVSTGLMSASREIREKAQTIGAITGIRRINRKFEIVKGTSKMRKADLIKRADLLQKYAYQMARTYDIRRGKKDITLRPQSEKAFQTFNKRFENEEDKLTRAEWDQMASVFGELQDEFDDFGSEIYVIYDITKGKYSFDLIGEITKKVLRKATNKGFEKKDIISVVMEKLFNNSKDIDELIEEQEERKRSAEKKKKGL